MKLTNLKITPKLGILVGITLLGLCAAGVLAGYLMQREMLNGRVEQTRAIVDMARNMALGLGMSTADGTIPTNGVQPLATFVFAALHALAGGDKIHGLVAVTLVSVLAAMLAAVALFALLRRLFDELPDGETLALAAASIWFAAPLIVRHSMNGLETGLYHAAMPADAERFRDEDVLVVGGGNSAGQVATHLARHARSVRVAVRGEGLSSTMSRYLVDRIELSPRIEVLPGTEVVALHGRGIGTALLEGVAGAVRNLLPLLVTAAVAFALLMAAAIALLLVGAVLALLHPVLAVAVFLPLYMAFVLVVYVVMFGVMYHLWRDIAGDAPAATAGLEA